MTGDNHAIIKPRDEKLWPDFKWSLTFSQYPKRHYIFRTHEGAKKAAQAGADD